MSRRKTGKLTTSKPKRITLREALNKIIHAQDIEWNFSQPDVPLIVCTAPQQQIDRRGWTKAEIRIDTLGTACGLFAKMR
jgi:hypothetical protein